ncbi:MAG: ion channel [candidate division KSB1 bacterium]|nr:ion channel [candidate division KSB1 bacterium]
MPRPKRRKRGWHDWFALWARRFRTVASVAIVIFVLCYVLGAFVRIGKSSGSYVQAGGAVATLVGGANLLRAALLRRRRSVFWAMALLPIFFVAGILEYYIICHRDLYWIILALLAVAVALNVYEFALSLRAVWRGEAVSRESTLAQFAFLYVTTVLSYTLLYTILDPHVPHRLFKMEASIDPLLDFLYLSVITATTVGYGDIVPLTAGAKMLIMSQTIICYLFLSILIGLIVSWTSSYRGRRSSQTHSR